MNENTIESKLLNHLYVHSLQLDIDAKSREYNLKSSKLEQIITFNKMFLQLFEEYVVNDKDENNKLNNLFVKITAIVLHNMVTRMLYYTIVKFLYKYVQQQRPIELQSTINIVKEIVQNEVNGQSLEELLNNENDNCRFEQKIIKNVLNIYDNAKDPDRKIDDINEIFNPILQIIELNDVIPVSNDKSTMISYLNDNIIPFYKDYMYKEMILHMKQLFDKYNNYIINEYKYIEMDKELKTERRCCQ